MYQYQGVEDTIAAISTPIGHGGIGIVRLSGSESIDIVERIFEPRRQVSLKVSESFKAHYGWIKNTDDEIVDEVLVTVMFGPRSYTKEDVVEISCHGGMVSLRTILDLIHTEGARLAQPGEFTKRAFLNGRIDLTQAEAVLDIIHSKTDAFLKVSTNQLKGDLSSELRSIREQLMATYIQMEAIVNFPEDEIDTKGRQKLRDDIEQTKIQVKRLLASSDQGRILKEGIKIVLCGKPNAGKSSLLNVLLKTERAIVSDIAGTTRDTIEESAQIRGIPFQLIDTAGILEPRDLIEEEAVRRSHLYIQGADMVLLLIDRSQKLDQDDLDLFSKMKDQKLQVILNKCDLPASVSEDEIVKLCGRKSMAQISALQRSGIDQLEESIVNEVLQGEQDASSHVMVSNLRHINALKDGLNSLSEAQTSLDNGLSLEFVSEGVKLAVNYLDGITGRNIDYDLLDTIFSQFCIGK